jgi:metal-responsive CopG/Arc/MetJ family transcriptional regulator
MKRRIMRKSVMVPVRMDLELLKEIDIIAMRRNAYRSELIREALRDLVRKSRGVQKELQKGMHT